MNNANSRRETPRQIIDDFCEELDILASSTVPEGCADPYIGDWFLPIWIKMIIDDGDVKPYIGIKGIHLLEELLDCLEGLTNLRESGFAYQCRTEEIWLELVTEVNLHLKECMSKDKDVQQR